MISSHTLADSILEEARIHSNAMTFDDAPDLQAEGKHEKASAQFPLPSREIIAAVLEEVFWASHLTEEGRPCKPRLIYAPVLRPAAHRFEPGVALNRSNLRRLTPVQGPEGHLIWSADSGSPWITGVEGGGHPPEFYVASVRVGTLDIGWWSSRLLTLRAGTVSRRSQSAHPDVFRALDVVRNSLGTFDPVFLTSTIIAIANGGHGGSVWISRLTRIPDGIQVGNRVSPTNNPPLTKQEYQQRTAWVESVGHLAAIDGAVLLDAELRVLGFGAFIDVPESKIKVRCLSENGIYEPKSPGELGGGRHRSAVEFCSRFAPAAALVVSEDGRISLMWANEVNEPFWTPLSQLGFTHAIV
jgi:hypothetical protein